MENIQDSEDFCVADKDALLYVISKIKEEGVKIKNILDGMPDANSKKVKLALWDGIKKRRYASWGIEDATNPLDFVLIKTVEKAIVFHDEYTSKREMEAEGEK